MVNVWITPLLCILPTPLLSCQTCLFSIDFFLIHCPPPLKQLQTTEKCSAEVLFARGEGRRSAQVQASCEELLKINTLAQEEAFYQQCKMNQNLLSAQNLPGMYENTNCTETQDTSDRMFTWLDMCGIIKHHAWINFLHNTLTFWPTDSYGHIEPDMKPLWHLGIVASSFVMLNESTENTVYNMAQVANITQLVGRLILDW